jgi:hypothetical protein
LFVCFFMCSVFPFTFCFSLFLPLWCTPAGRRCLWIQIYTFKYSWRQQRQFLRYELLYLPFNNYLHGNIIYLVHTLILLALYASKF